MFQSHIELFDHDIKIKAEQLFDGSMSKGICYFLCHRDCKSQTGSNFHTERLTKECAESLYNEWTNTVQEEVWKSFKRPSLSKPYHYICLPYEITQISFKSNLKEHELLIVKEFDIKQMKQDFIDVEIRAMENR